MKSNKLLVAGILTLLLILSSMHANARDNSWIREGVSFLFFHKVHGSKEVGNYSITVTGTSPYNNATYKDILAIEAYSMFLYHDSLILTVDNSSDQINVIVDVSTNESITWWVSRYFENIIYANNRLQANHTTSYELVGIRNLAYNWTTNYSTNEIGDLMIDFFSNNVYFNVFEYFTYIPYFNVWIDLGNYSMAPIYIITNPDLTSLMDAINNPNVTRKTSYLEINGKMQDVTLDIYSTEILFYDLVYFEYYLDTNSIINSKSNSLLAEDQLLMNGTAYVYINHTFEMAFDSNTGMPIYLEYHASEFADNIFIEGSSIPYEIMTSEFAKDTYSITISGYSPYIETSKTVMLSEHSILYSPPNDSRDENNDQDGSDGTLDNDILGGQKLNLIGVGFEGGMFTIVILLILLPRMKKRK